MEKLRPEEIYGLLRSWLNGPGIPAGVFGLVNPLTDEVVFIVRSEDPAEIESLGLEPLDSGLLIDYLVGERR